MMGKHNKHGFHGRGYGKGFGRRREEGEGWEEYGRGFGYYGYNEWGEHQILRAFCNPLRLAILRLLRKGERSVGDIANELNAPQPSVSNQLSRLEFLGAVKGRREGKNVFYSIADERITKILSILDEEKEEKED